jgi:hypothetical protein
MAANVTGAQDLAGTLKPAQEQTAERIDGIVALIMAIGRALVATTSPSPSTPCSFCERRSMPHTWDTELQAMTGLGPFCPVAPRIRAVAAGAAGAGFRPNPVRRASSERCAA